MHTNSTRTRILADTLTIATLYLVVASAPAWCQTTSDAGAAGHVHGATSPDKVAPDKAPATKSGMMDMHARHMEAMQAAGGAPRAAGQDAFGAIQEIVQKLEADPKTDWTKVDLEGLRTHLIDMNEVTLNAIATTRPIEGGVEIAVSGSGRTLAAIQRMIPAHAREIDGLNGWSSKALRSPDGEILTVTSSDPKQVAHIRGLGFIGILVSGAHHQAHHIAMAKGEFALSH